MKDVRLEFGDWVVFLITVPEARFSLIPRTSASPLVPFLCMLLPRPSNILCCLLFSTTQVDNSLVSTRSMSGGHTPFCGHVVFELVWAFRLG